MAILDPIPAQFEFATFNSIKVSSQGAASSKAPFLFIVKTPTSGTLSRSTTRSAAASINSHAQRWAQEAATSKTLSGSGAQRQTDTLLFEKCLTRCRVSRLLDDPNKPSRGRRSVNAKQTSHTTRKRSTKPKKLPSESLCAIIGQDLSPSPESESRRQQDSSEDEYLDDGVMQQLLAPPSGSFHNVAVDPFDCTAGTIDCDMVPILEYYLSFALLSRPRDDDGQRPTDAAFAQHFASIDAIIQGCMRKSVHMYALLAATASRMRRVSDISFRADNGPEIYLHKALQCLRSLLDSQSAAEDRQIILDIYYLSVCGWYMENYGESKTHFNVLKHFWKTLIPGQSTLDQYIHDMLNYNAIFLESDATNLAELVATPELLCPSTVNGTIYQSNAWHPNRIWSDRHFSAFPAALEQTRCSPNLKGLIEELHSLLQLYHHLLRSRDFIGPETDWFHGKSKFLVVRLLELPSYGSELCCRLSLVLLLQRISQSTPTKLRSTDYSSSAPDKHPLIDPASITQRLRRELQYEILQPSNEIPSVVVTPPQFNDEALVIWTGKSNPLLLWILITGLFGARITVQEDEHQWFLARVVPSMRLLGIETMGRLEELTRSFVWVEGLLEDQAFEEIFGKISVSGEEDG
ncbi:uncharacterized protein Z519_04856 [Cladophialophora bantiana CBS 173.52]|uniref:Uncharacterized protein n=1 Tax=Cladophialophora bantiana (strain ATCC 10958 / CBS 173.52 / CDC B-1940 / NIH 8579) TaxID=1442370 RepID=A0A0D2HNA1_CLAB1|nr:uncharacterized protein Z519_04856 [Cladophialophora bantiana CBS 173.52]KIW94878.1 hypothetical protein Z519_04856 [Cladophialophora bantiana CBS 173.52]